MRDQARLRVYRASIACKVPMQRRDRLLGATEDARLIYKGERRRRTVSGTQPAAREARAAAAPTRAAAKCRLPAARERPQAGAFHCVTPVCAL